MQRLFANAKKALSRTSKVDASGRVTITPRQIYIIPTGFGIVFAILLIGMLIGSNNYGINLGFILTFFLAGMGFATMLQSWRNIAHLEILPAPAEPVFCGDNAVFVLHFANTRPSPRPGIQIRNIGRSSVFDLGGNETRPVSHIVKSTRRGVLSPRSWSVMSWFPFGMFYVWAYFHSGQSCLVYPRPAPRTAIDELFRTALTDEMDGDDSHDFYGHSKYQPGDNLRQLDWKVLARGRGKLIKIFRKSGDGEVWLNWDDILLNDGEQILSVLCRAIIELHEAEIAYGLNIPGAVIGPEAGIEHKHRCLRALALFGK